MDKYVSGSDAYKNYLRADIFNEVYNLNFLQDNYGVEWGLLAYGKPVIAPAYKWGFGQVNVGLGQVGPHSDPTIWEDIWLNDRGWNGFDVLDNDSKNLQMTDALISDRIYSQIIPKELKSSYISCQNPRSCNAIWVDKSIIFAVAGARLGDDLVKSPDHPRKIFNLTQSKAGSQYYLFDDFKKYEYLK